MPHVSFQLEKSLTVNRVFKESYLGSSCFSILPSISAVDSLRCSRLLSCFSFQNCRDPRNIASMQQLVIALTWPDVSQCKESGLISYVMPKCFTIFFPRPQENAFPRSYIGHYCLCPRCDVYEDIKKVSTSYRRPPQYAYNFHKPKVAEK